MAPAKRTIMFEIAVRDAEDPRVWVDLVNETTQRCPGASPLTVEGAATYGAAGHAAPEELLLVALGVGEAPIGAVGLRRSGEWGIVAAFAIIQGMRQQGVGRMVLERVVERLGTARALAVCWPVEAYHRFYGEAMGWRLAGEYSKYVWPAAPGTTAAPDLLTADSAAPAAHPLAGQPAPAGAVAFAGGATVLAARLEPGSLEADLFAPSWPIAGDALSASLAWAAGEGARSAGLWLYRAIEAADPTPAIEEVGGHLARVWTVFERP